MSPLVRGVLPLERFQKNLNHEGFQYYRSIPI
jgi:hypothetical protein